MICIWVFTLISLQIAGVFGVVILDAMVGQENKLNPSLLKFLKHVPESQDDEVSGRKAEKDLKGNNEKALEQMCRVIFNLNEFVYPD